MVSFNNQPSPQKLSAEFASRLAQLAAGEVVRAIVLLATRVDAPKGRRPTANERRVIAELVRRQAEQALPEIDAILEDYGGERYSPRPDVLGSVTVETTVDGISALAASEKVVRILEDQSIFPLAKP